LREATPRATAGDSIVAAATGDADAAQRAGAMARTLIEQHR
jgi:hypothetical protein